MSDQFVSDEQWLQKQREAGLLPPVAKVIGPMSYRPEQLEEEKRECAYYLNVVWPEICGGPEETTGDRLKDDVMDVWEGRPEAMFKK